MKLLPATDGDLKTYGSELIGGRCVARPRIAVGTVCYSESQG